MAPREPDLAVCDQSLPPGGVPEWVHLLPPPGQIIGRDGRQFVYLNPAAVINETAARGLDLVVDFEHQSESEAARRAGPVKAAGWVRELRADASGVWGRVEWTETAREMIAAREYRYVSPTLLVEPGTSRIMALRSVALVHHPALRLTALAHEEVAPVLLSEPRPAPDLPAPDLPAPAPAVPDMPPAAPDALLERLAGALGLSPEALAEEGVAVIRQMQAALRRLVGAQAGEVATAAELARIAAPDPARFVPVEAVADVACGALAERMRHAEERTAAKVDRALRDGQLTPAMRDWAVALCRADEASFDTFLARSGAPFAHLFRPAVPAGPPPSSGGHSYSEGSAADLVAQQLGLKPGALG